MSNYITDERFHNQDFPPPHAAGTEYADCTFVACRLTDADLSGIRFTDCAFQDCDLSNAKLTGTSFQSVRFDNCKLLGLSFDDCAPLAFAAQCSRCRMQHVSFQGMKLTRCRFTGCDLTEADFTGTDLTGIDLTDCDLDRATFDGTDLRKTDLRESRGYRIDPNENKVRGARFSLPEAVGLLAGFGVRVD